jgi:hypothetical protein
MGKIVLPAGFMDNAIYVLECLVSIGFPAVRIRNHIAFKIVEVCRWLVGLKDYEKVTTYWWSSGPYAKRYLGADLNQLEISIINRSFS